MSVRLSIYDFFAYTIPGGIILAIVLYITQKYQFLLINLSDLSTPELLAIAVLAYLVGFFIDPISKNVWYRFFCPKNLHQIALNDFNKRHPDIKVPFQKMDWYISFAYIQRCSSEMAQVLDHLNVTNIMLRNSSFGLLILSLVFAFEFTIHNFLPIYVIVSILCLMAAIVLVRQAVKYRLWFFEGIYQSLVALISEPKRTSVTVNKNSKAISTVQRKDEKS